MNDNPNCIVIYRQAEMCSGQNCSVNEEFGQEQRIDVLDRLSGMRRAADGALTDKGGGMSVQIAHASKDIEISWLKTGCYWPRC